MLAVEALGGNFVSQEQAKLTTPQEMLDAALTYARNGFSIFPLQPRSKWPMFLYGDEKVERIRATSDPDHIKQLWDEFPDANLGIATGTKSGCFVVDVDGTDGEYSLYRLQDRFGRLPDTAEVKTGKGRHIYYETVPGIKSTISKLGHNIDVRGESGYVVAPPSIHENGNIYKWWEPPPIIKAPQWLIDRVR